MDSKLPFSNWSIKKTLETEPDSFIKARIRIIFTILVFSLVKAFIVIGIGAAHGQWLQVARAIVVCVFYTVLAKILLARPASLKLLAHIMILIGIAVVWTNILIYAHNVNLVTVQFVFMIALSSFYILGSRLGLAYSFVGILPVLLFLFFHSNTGIYLTRVPEEFASPGFEIIIVLNFVSIIVAHYLFYDAYATNIREKEKLNQQLQLSVAEANKMAASKSNFLSTISHELRTPLNSVVGIAELLLEDEPEERQQENLKILHHSALDLLSLINNVLDFNKIDSDKLTLEHIPFRLADFMENICLGLKIKANDKRLDFTLNIDERLRKTTVVSDTTRLSQVIYNLVSNAIKFTEQGSINIKLELIGETEDRVEVLFSVKDTGIGIHRDRHETIFDLFSQAESDTTRKYGGSGLGLAIVKQVVALFGSTIQLESSPANGTQFFFTLSLTTMPEIAGKELPDEKNPADLGHLKILVAEDNNFNRRIVQKQFEKLNIAPVIVENGRLAYEACLSGDYDAILVDLHMPELDGYATIKLIRAIPDPAKANVRIVAFTASITEQQKIMENGFDDFLYKPVNMNDLRDKLEGIAALQNVGLR